MILARLAVQTETDPHERTRVGRQRVALRLQNLPNIDLELDTP